MLESTSHEEHRELYLLDLKVMWVPPYSLTFVCMKWAFGMSKKKLVSIRDNAIINLFKNNDKICVVNTLSKSCRENNLTEVYRGN